jgi:adenylyltransferase/sulfurtransferase
MQPRRLSIHFPAAEAAADLHAAIPLFHRFIQERAVEGLLIDVADYLHVPQGPGVLLIGHDVDYGLDPSGLTVTRKRAGEDELGALLVGTLRMGWGMLRALDRDGSLALEIARERFDVSVLDREELASAPDAGAELASEVAAALTPLLGEAKVETRGADPREPVTVRVVAAEIGDLDGLLEKLGAPDPKPEAQSEWDLSAEELARLKGQEFMLVDVREQKEYDICNLGGELIPLGTLPERMSELPKDAHIVVHCKVGKRGANAVQQLRAAGFENAWNLNGGILAWIDRIDPSLTRY